MPTKSEIPWTEFTGPGSAFKVVEQYKKGELNESGEKAIFISPEVIQKKKPKSIN